MRVSHFVIHAEVFDQVKDYLKRKIEHEHVYQSADTVLLGGEEHRFRTGSMQSYYIAVRRDSGSTFVEVNCSGGGEGLFRITWGSERALIRMVSDEITRFCEDRNLHAEEIEVM